jgi:hypothetical protein
MHAVGVFAVVREFPAGTLTPLVAAIPQTGCYTRKVLEPKVQTIIDEFRASVPGTMSRGGVLGAAIDSALVSGMEKDGFLCLTESKFFQMIDGLRSVNEKLQGVRPGVFTTQGGGTLDFTRDVPTWCNYRLQPE